MNEIPVVANADQLKRWAGAMSDLFTYPEREAPDLSIFEPIAPVGALPSGSHSLTSLQTEYTRLFISDFPEVTCSPFASVYLEGSIMAESSASLAKLYRSIGLECRTHPPDHLAAELEALAFLLTLDTAVAPADTALREMVVHLSTWTPRFFDSVALHDTTGFYSGAAQIGRTVIQRIVAFQRRDH